MSDRWNLSNTKNEMISHAQFMLMTQQLKDFSEAACGKELTLDIRVMSENKKYTTLWDDAQQALLDAEN